MSSLIRTALAGVGVIAACMAMASLKGHHLLLTFAAASLVCSIWSWLQHSREPIRNSPIVEEDPPLPFFEEPAVPFRRSGRTSNVYTFPSVGALSVSDASS